MRTDRCTCPECLELDQLPERLQGIPGSWQFKLPLAPEVEAPQPTEPVI